MLEDDLCFCWLIDVVSQAVAWVEHTLPAPEVEELFRTSVLHVHQQTTHQPQSSSSAFCSEHQRCVDDCSYVCVCVMVLALVLFSKGLITCREADEAAILWSQRVAADLSVSRFATGWATN